MSSKDNSYSQLTKRLRSKYNASFYQNNNTGQVNIFNTGVGDITNEWINGLVTGRKDVISTSDLGFRNVDDSCICGPAPAPAPAPEPVEGDSILLMAGGSLYVATTLGKLFKANNPDTNTLTKAYSVSLGNFTNFIPYILQVGANHVYVVGYEIANPSINYIIVKNKLDGSTVRTIELDPGGMIVISGLNEITNSLSADYLYVSYIVVLELGDIYSYIQLYDMANNFSDYGSRIDLYADLPSPVEALGIITIGNVIAVDGLYYVFTNMITAFGATIKYNLQLTRWNNFDLSPDVTTYPEGYNILLDAEVSPLLILNFSALRQNTRPIIYTDSGERTILAIPQIIYPLGSPSPSITGLVMVRVNLDNFGNLGCSELVSLDISLLSYNMSSPFLLGPYLYCSAGSAVAGDNKIYGINSTFNTIASPFASNIGSSLDATNYSITNDGTQYTYRVATSFGILSIERYDGSAGPNFGDTIITPDLTSTPYGPIILNNTPNIVFNNACLYANDSDATISKLDLDTLDFDPIVRVNILL